MGYGKLSSRDNQVAHAHGPGGGSVDEGSYVAGFRVEPRPGNEVLDRLPVAVHRGDEVITEGNILSHLPATFDAKSIWFNTLLKSGQQVNIVTDGGFTLEELRKYFVPGNLVLANFVCGGDHGLQLEKVVPMVITVGDGMIMQPAGIAYDSVTEAHYDCIFAVVNNEQVGAGGVGLDDGVTLLYSVTEIPSHADRTSTSSLKGFTVFDLVSHSI